MLSIRDANVADLPTLLAIYNHSVRLSTATFDLVDQTIEERREWFSHYGGKHPLIVDEIDGQVAGYCSLSRYRHKPAYDHTVESSVYVDERFQRRGIGGALMQEVLRRASDLRHHVVVAGITGGNDASVRLHLNLGFQYVGCFREVGFKFGQWQDVHFYQLILAG